MDYGAGLSSSTKLLDLDMYDSVHKFVADTQSSTLHFVENTSKNTIYVKPLAVDNIYNLVTSPVITTMF